MFERSATSADVVEIAKRSHNAARGGKRPFLRSYFLCFSCAFFVSNKRMCIQVYEKSGTDSWSTGILDNPSSA